MTESNEGNLSDQWLVVEAMNKSLGDPIAIWPEDAEFWLDFVSACFLPKWAEEASRRLLEGFFDAVIHAPYQERGYKLHVVQWGLMVLYFLGKLRDEGDELSCDGDE